MAKELRCCDVGMNCDFKARGETTEMPPELAAKVRAAIRNV